MEWIYHSSVRRGSLFKEEYLGGIASGQLDYLHWEPETIAVRSNGSVAVIRHKSQLEIVVQGLKIFRRPYWHTDLTKTKFALAGRLASGDGYKIGIHVPLIFAANKRSAVAILASSPSAGSIQP